MFKTTAENSEKSTGMMKPGLNIAATLAAVVIDDNDNLKITFKGVLPENGGSYTFVVFASTFDPSNERSTDKDKDNDIKRLQQVIEAFVAKPSCYFEAADWKAFATKTQALLTPAIGNKAFLKVVYKNNTTDEKITFPKFGAFISTDLVPRSFKLDTKVDGNNIPYDRILPLEHYGVLAASKSAPGSLISGMPSAAPAPIGAMPAPAPIITKAALPVEPADDLPF